jgi:glucokinase
VPEILVADIGGTNSRVGFAEPGGRPQRILSVANDSVDGPEGVLARALEGVSAPPPLAVLALAAPVAGEEIALTNRDWVLRPKQLAARFGIAKVHALNDFEALAYALPAFTDQDLQPVGEALAFPHGAKLVLGPGTGLGVAALIPSGDDWQAVASEAGHVSFGAAYPDEEAVFRRLAEKQMPVTAEHVLSGPGLSRLHLAMYPGLLGLKPEMILRQARAGDREARATAAMFVRLFGRFAGDMALAFRATGGVYIAGGVAAALGPLFDARLFRAAFERHPPYENLLKTVPSALITCPEPGLIGCAAVAERLLAGT